MSYNCQKETWSLNELISHCVQEEERLKRDKIESAHLAMASKDKRNKRKKTTVAAVLEPQKKQKKDENPNGCYFCGSEGHVKKHCTNYYTWREKKGMPLNLVCSEVNLTPVPRHTCWLDSAATTHISVSMQGCLICRKPSDERYIYVGDGNPVEVEEIGTFRLLLRTGFYLDLIETYVVPSLRRNLVFVLVLDTSGYCCSFGNGKVLFFLSKFKFGWFWFFITLR